LLQYLHKATNWSSSMLVNLDVLQNPTILVVTKQCILINLKFLQCNNNTDTCKKHKSASGHFGEVETLAETFKSKTALKM